MPSIGRWGASVTSPLLAPFRRGSTPNGDKGRKPATENGNGKHERDEMLITKEMQERMDARERTMLNAILRLDQATAREVMVPRVDMVTAEKESSLRHVAQQMAQTGHSRLPVYDTVPDHIIGVLHARDVLGLLADATDRRDVKDIIRPTHFIPESKLLDDLLQEMQEKHIQMAIVVDEYGGTEGLVTVEDLLEEIVGEIEDEFSALKQDPQVISVAEGDMLVDPMLSLDDLTELMGTDIGEPAYDTIGAYVQGTLGKLPEAGDEVALGELNVRVVSLLGRRMRKLRVMRNPV
jgi:CBS domain containing-hemolysin-like protein